MDAFVYEAPAQRVVFGHGTRERLGDEIARLGHERALVLSGARQGEDAEALAGMLGPQAAGVFAGAAMHTPTDVTETALAMLGRSGADCLVALGGGSAIGLAKALALRTGLDQIALPTTYAGSEATPILGQTENGRKTTLRNAAVLPETILYDVDLTLDLPVALSIASGLNAMAHAVEALYAEARNPMTGILAIEAVKALAQALQAIRANAGDRPARARALYGAWAAGTCLGTVGMALHHRICHVLGGSFGLPHAETHAVMLPYVVAFNELAAGGALRPVAEALGADSAAEGLFALSEALDAPRDLQSLGMTVDGLDSAAALAVATPLSNPRAVTEDRVRAILDDAFTGAGLAPGRGRA